MSAPLNGKRAPPATAGSPIEDIARMVQEALREGAEDAAWDDLTDEERQGEIYLAEHYLAAHAQWLLERGYKVVPPGAVPVPKSDEEALAMVKAAKGYFDAQKRKGKLVDTASPARLILPPGSKPQ